MAMTFDEWRKQFPCMSRKGYEEHVVDCLHCDCACEAWDVQDANYAPLVEACEKLFRYSGLLNNDADLQNLHPHEASVINALKALKEAMITPMKEV